MPILIAGCIDMDPNRAEAAIRDARGFIEASRREEGCVAYDWALDPLVPGRVHVFEEWTDQSALEGHFQDESYLAMRNHLQNCGVKASSVKKYRSDASEAVYDGTGTPRADFCMQDAA